MLIEKTLPYETLRDYFIEYYFISLNSGDLVKTIPIIDDCSYDFVFFKEADAILYYGRPTKKVHICHPIFTIHDVTPPYKISFKGDLNFFTIKLQPWQNGTLFSGLRTKGVSDVSSVISPDLEFYNQIFQLTEVSEKFDLANIELRKLHFEKSTSKELVKSLCQTIRANQGMITVNELSEQFQKSRQYLNKVFKQHVLYNLKKYITTIRILDLVKYKSKHSDLSLTELAHNYEYYDQAHFINDFKNVCGVSPKHFFEHLPEFLLRHK